MNSGLFRSLVACTVLWAVSPGGASFVRAGAADDAPAARDERPGGLKVLDRWVGEWDMEVVIKPGALNPEGTRSTFRMTTAWTLNGRVLRCDSAGEGTAGAQKFKDAFTWICTFDPRAGNYVSTVFWSNVPPPGGGGGGDGRGRAMGRRAPRRRHVGRERQGHDHPDAGPQQRHGRQRDHDLDRPRHARLREHADRCRRQGAHGNERQGHPPQVSRGGRPGPAPHTAAGVSRGEGGRI